MSCERCEGRWCGAECFAYKQGKADERNRIAEALELEGKELQLFAMLSFAARLRKGEV